MRRPQFDEDTALLQEAYTAATLIETLVERELHARGVPASLFSLLSWIRVRQPVTPTELSAVTGIPLTGLRDMTRRLEGRGDVTRTPNPSDGRSYLLNVTPQGKRVVDRGRPAIAAALKQVEPHLPRSVGEYTKRATELREALQRAVDVEEALPRVARRGSG
jgi:DNA-binding MarR family transcriptional regulator